MSKCKFDVVALFLAALLGIAHEAQAIDAEDRAKIAKEKAKINAVPLEDGESGSRKNDGDQCGAVDIGNVFTDGKPATGTREVNVIVTGDIFNVDNKCK